MGGSRMPQSAHPMPELAGLAGHIQHLTTNTLGLVRATVAGIAILLAAACATPAPILIEDVGAIRSGAVAARQQAEDSFAAANDLARDQAIERKVRQPNAILRQTDFPQPVSAEAARKWNQAFSVLDQYGAALQSLVDPARAAETAEAIGELGQGLQSGPLNANLPNGLTAVFQTFGQALIQARAESKATAVMRSTDPAFNQLVGEMATAIGEPDEPGSLSNTVRSAWENSVIPLIENEYASTDTDDEGTRRRLITSYLEAMSERDKQLSDLTLLQQSLLALGEAHSAAAQGRPGDALFWIGRINGWADDIRKRLPEKGDEK